MYRGEQKSRNPTTRPDNPTTRAEKSEKNGQPDFRVQPDPTRACSGSGSVWEKNKTSGSGSNPKSEKKSEKLVKLKFWEYYTDIAC